CAQGFPDDYKIDVDAEGNAVTKAAQVRMCGNSVCPPVAAAMVAAQFGKGEVQSDLFSQAA
ncbi:MAG: DNA cytosine methyltransferase, partial [Rhodocyclaceae bacterium]|nr:DNA cytosine methyltransferase [Rhodocyclaceae bacterium]